MQIEAWETLAASDALRAVLGERRAQVTRDIGGLLSAWRRAGGRVSLDLAGEGAGEPEEEPPAEEPPAEAPVVVEAPRPAEPPPPEVRPAPARPAGPPASVDAIAGLKERFESGGAFSVPEIDPNWPAFLGDTLKQLAATRDPDTHLNTVLHVVAGWDRWMGLPSEAQRALAGALAARLRTLQEVAFPEDRRIAHAFGILSAFMKKARPGFVSGLSRTHRPARETWEADAEAFFERLYDMLPTPAEDAPNVQRALQSVERLVAELETAPDEVRDAISAQLRRDVGALLAQGVSARNPRLVRVVAPAASALDGGEFRALRRAIRDEQEAAREEASEDEAPADLPADWAWWPMTRARRAVMIGGSPRELNRARLEKVFGFAELDWLPAEFRRNSLQTIRDRVKNGGVDMVIILRSFVGHDADQVILPACREAGVGWVSVEQGYGVVRVRQAIERYLDPEDAVKKRTA
ncbi:MAG: hypothetical protein ACOZNI_16525 [Myxococcota bacterium]